VTPELADPFGPVEIGQHEGVEEFGAGSRSEVVQALAQSALELIGPHQGFRLGPAPGKHLRPSHEHLGPKNPHRPKEPDGTCLSAQIGHPTPNTRRPSRVLTGGTLEATVANAEVEGGLDFAGFFHAEYEPLLRTMYLMCRNLAEAEDLSQEAMARALERWDTVQTSSSPRAYVYAIALNLRRSALRRAALAIQHRHIDPPVPDEPDTIAERRVEVLRALRALPKSQREALLLVEWVGMTSEEAGQVLGVEAESVRGRVHRARRALRERYGGSSDG
jgi:RNA polymerase sigma-70 factor, ECF subfamily